MRIGLGAHQVHMYIHCKKQAWSSCPDAVCPVSWGIYVVCYGNGYPNKSKGIFSVSLSRPVQVVRKWFILAVNIRLDLGSLVAECPS